MLEFGLKARHLKSAEQQETLLELVEEIDSRRLGQHWSLGLDDLSLFLSLSREDLLRWQYQVGNGRLFGVGDLEYSEENVADLIALLEAIGYAEASACFFQNGYYIDDDHSIYWLEFFQSVVLSRLLSDEVDPALLEDAVRGSRYFDDAVRYYGHSHFDKAALIEFAIPLFIEKYELTDHDFCWHLYREDIKSRLQLAYLRWDMLFDAMLDRLLDYALRLGFVEADQVQSRPKAVLGLDPEMKAALKLLEFPSGTIPDLAALKAQYRKMLLKHHPDHNPDGQERTRDLIQAYNFLLAHLN